MNDKGQIKEFETVEQAKAEGFDTILTEAEAQELNALPEEKRVLRLLTTKFLSKQNKRTPGEKKAMGFSFEAGFNAAVALINKD